jgi:hypothetical protein
MTLRVAWIGTLWERPYKASLIQCSDYLPTASANPASKDWLKVGSTPLARDKGPRDN